jgi:hypothetical protein
MMCNWSSQDWGSMMSSNYRRSSNNWGCCNSVTCKEITMVSNCRSISRYNMMINTLDQVSCFNGVALRKDRRSRNMNGSCCNYWSGVNHRSVMDGCSYNC